MRADAFPLDTVLSEKQQWVVPVYQRHYEWEVTEDKQLPKLWDDLKDKTEEILDKRRPYPHYFGAIIYSEPSGQPFGSIRKRYLVDGQQRITTFELVLITIREVARERDFTRIQDVVDAYLFNESSKGMTDPEREKYKLWPSAYDRQVYRHLVDNPRCEIRKLLRDCFYINGNLIKGKAPNLLRAYWFLFETITAFIQERTDDDITDEIVLDALLTGFLTGFQIVMIHLDENDDAQEIFSSLNGMAKPLSPFDLIRNDVFHRARKIGEDDEKLFDERWKEFEQPFWNEQVRQGRLKRARADHLITHAVVAETAREVNAGKIATEYKHYAKERSFSTIADELDVLLGHARTYRNMEQLSDTVTADITKFLRIWDLSTFHPVILWINAQDLECGDKMILFSFIEKYIVRRELCGLTTKSYNKAAIMMIRSLRENKADPSSFIKDISKQTGDGTRLPSDSEVLESVVKRSIYGSISVPKIRYIMQQIEYAKRTKFDETILETSNITIEHIMPQKWAKNWPLPSGEIAPYETVYQAALDNKVIDDKLKSEIEMRQQCVNLLGNLTLVTESLNPSLSNAEWSIKREKLSKSLLVLNREIIEKITWDELSINDRSENLGTLVNDIWSLEHG